MTLNEIRKELQQIKFYYSNKEELDRSMSLTGNAEFMEIVEKYNKAILSAEPKFYCLYAGLYLDCHTQESLGDKWGYTQEHISYMHNGLLKFFQKNFLVNICIRQTTKTNISCATCKLKVAASLKNSHERSVQSSLELRLL